MLFKKKKSKTNPEDETLDIEVLDADDLDGDEEDAAAETEDAAEAAAPPKKKLPAWAIWPIIGVLVLGVAGASALGKTTKKTADTKLHVVEVTTGNIREVYNASGTIESENTKTYYSPVTAPITNCNAEVGKLVKSGDLLVTFDTKNLERDNQQAQLTLQSSYNSSQSTREKNAKAIAQAQEAVNKANAALADQANALADKVNTIGAQLDQAEATYDASTEKHNKKENLERIAELQAQIATLESQIAVYNETIYYVEVFYGGDRTEYDAAIDRRENGTPQDGDEHIIRAFETYTQVKYTDLPKAQQELEAAKAELAERDFIDDGGYPTLSEQYNAAYAEWQAAYNAAMNGSGGSTSDVGMSSTDMANLDISDNLAELTALTPEELLQKGREGMKADMDGVIASVETLGTNSAAQGAAVFSIASTKNVRVAIEISPDDYYKIKTGTEVNITAGDSKYTGNVSYINKIAVKNAKGNPAIGVRIHINNPDDNICIGSSAKVSMTVAQSDNVLVVPTEAINASTNGNFVFVIENGVVKKKPVELGTSSTTQVEIVSGLKKGDQVVNELTADVSEGMKASPITAEKDAKNTEK